MAAAATAYTSASTRDRELHLADAFCSFSHEKLLLFNFIIVISEYNARQVGLRLVTPYMSILEDTGSGKREDHAVWLGCSSMEMLRFFVIRQQPRSKNASCFCLSCHPVGRTRGFQMTMES